MMTLFDEDPEDVLQRIVTQDEIWVPHFHPETKEESKQYKYRYSPSLKVQGREVGRGREGDDDSLLTC